MSDCIGEVFLIDDVGLTSKPREHIKNCAKDMARRQDLSFQLYTLTVLPYQK